jgi:Co/Zn/Cd efflux system component
LTAWLIHEAVNKIISKDDRIDSMIMLVTAGVGLISNIIMCKILHSGVNQIINKIHNPIILGRSSSLRRRNMFS